MEKLLIPAGKPCFIIIISSFPICYHTSSIITMFKKNKNTHENVLLLSKGRNSSFGADRNLLKKKKMHQSYGDWLFYRDLYTGKTEKRQSNGLSHWEMEEVTGHEGLLSGPKLLASLRVPVSLQRCLNRLCSTTLNTPPRESGRGESSPNNKPYDGTPGACLTALTEES